MKISGFISFKHVIFFSFICGLECPSSGMKTGKISNRLLGVLKQGPVGGQWSKLILPRPLGLRTGQYVSLEN